MDYLNQARNVSLNLPVHPNVSPKLGNKSLSSPSLLRAGLMGQSLFAEDAFEVALDFDARGIVRKQNQGEGCFSCGWVFDPIQEFDFDRLMAFVQRQTQGASLLRLKAVMITEQGIAGFNWVDHELSLVELDDSLDSRLEMIAMGEWDWDEIEAQLLACLSV
jgi:hypothetical protein